MALSGPWIPNLADPAGRCVPWGSNPLYVPFNEGEHTLGAPEDVP